MCQKIQEAEFSIIFFCHEIWQSWILKLELCNEKSLLWQCYFFKNSTFGGEKNILKFVRILVTDTYAN